MEVFLQSDIETELEDVYAPRLQEMMGLSPSQAKLAFRDLLKKAKEQSLEEGTSNLPEGFGDILLQKESTDEKVKSWLAMKRNEGVKDEDIREWWNMHDLERRVLLGFDDMTRVIQFSTFGWEDQIDEKELATEGERFFPAYGDPNEPSLTTGDDRPLPYELKSRVDRYLEKRSQADLKALKKAVEGSSTFNAFIRREIKRGNL
jgi:hypothetical protein